MPRKMSRRRSSWGQIDRRASGRYRARYTVPETGELITLGTFDLRGDAEAALTTVRVDMQRGTWKHPKTRKAEVFGEYARAWVAAQVNATGEPLRPRTRAEYERYLDKGLADFCGERVVEISPAMVRSWHLERSKSGKTAAAREARLLRAVFNSAVDDELVDRNPVDSRLCRTAAGLKHRPPTEDELAGIVAVFESVAPELRLAVLLAAYGGLRLSEWRALRRSDLALIEGRYVVQVQRQAQRTPRSMVAEGAPAWTVGLPKSAEGVRSVTLPAWLTDDVTEHLATHTKRFNSSLLFAPRGGSEFLDDQRFNKPWNVARERLGLRVKVSGEGEPPRYESAVREHDLRGFAATYYVRGGATMREVQALLGHGSTDAALAYQHAVGDRAGELADRMPAPSRSPKVPASLDAAREARA